MFLILLLPSDEDLAKDPNTKPRVCNTSAGGQRAIKNTYEEAVSSLERFTEMRPSTAHLYKICELVKR